MEKTNFDNTTNCDFSSKEKVKITCKNGLYLENFIDENLERFIKYKALFDINPASFFGIYNSKKELIGEICNSTFFGLVIHTHRERNYKKCYRTGVLRAFCDFTFTESNEEKISCVINPGELQSIKLHEKIGFVMQAPEGPYISSEYILTREKFYGMKLASNVHPKKSLELVNSSEEVDLGYLFVN